MDKGLPFSPSPLLPFSSSPFPVLWHNFVLILAGVYFGFTSL
ncbi:hypothetical protein MKY25_02375 [Geobacillus sp. FSL W8-0032]